MVYLVYETDLLRNYLFITHIQYALKIVKINYIFYGQVKFFSQNLHISKGMLLLLSIIIISTFSHMHLKVLNDYTHYLLKMTSKYVAVRPGSRENRFFLFFWLGSFTEYGLQIWNSRSYKKKCALSNFIL